jgi:hypothetical protein
MLVRLCQQLRGEHHQRCGWLPERQQRQQCIIWMAALKVTNVGGAKPCGSICAGAAGCEDPMLLSAAALTPLCP